MRAHDLLECSEQEDQVVAPIIPEPYDEPSHHDFEVGPRTVLIWFVGTNVYSFVDIHDRRLQHFNSIPEEKAEAMLSKTALKEVK